MGKLLGAKLMDLRRNANLTQEEAARKLEEYRIYKKYPENYIITRSALANYEKGIRTPNLVKMQLIADFYRVEVIDLILISEDDLDIGLSPDLSARVRKVQHNIMDTNNKRPTQCNKQNTDYDRRNIDDNDNQDMTTITIPLITNNKERIDSLLPSDFVLSYSSRREFIMMDKYRQLKPENRAKIEERIDMLLEMQQDSTDNKK